MTKKRLLSEHITQNTDKYFSNTKKIVESYGDCDVVYAIFVRKPAIYACKEAIFWLKEVAVELNFAINIYENFQEGERVPAGEPLFYVEGSFAKLVELETLLLQKVGATCLCAWHGYMMSIALKNVGFIAMDARHCTGAEMVNLVEYGISIGSVAAKKEGAVGFIGSSVENNVKYFNAKEALGTMPHALIGYSDSTLEAAKRYNQVINSQSLTVLVDYFGKEVSDSLEVCEHFKDLAKEGNLAIRLDTHGGRFLEGLNSDKSYQIIEKYCKEAFYNYKTNTEINFLAGMGVSAAAIFYLREQLNKEGFDRVKIVASSGFNLEKCQLMAKVNAPIDVIGTGSFIPNQWSDTYATADIISYDGRISVKSGREYLCNKWFAKK